MYHTTSERLVWPYVRMAYPTAAKRGRDFRSLQTLIQWTIHAGSVDPPRHHYTTMLCKRIHGDINSSLHVKCTWHHRWVPPGCYTMFRANDDRGFTKEYLRVCTMAWQEITTHVRRHRRYLCVTDQTYRHCVYVSCRYSAAYTRLLIAAFIHSFHLFEHDSSMYFTTLW